MTNCNFVPITEKKISNFKSSRTNLYPIFNEKFKFCSKNIYLHIQFFYRLNFINNFKYRGSPVSTIFWLMRFCTIRGIALIGEWFSTKTCEIAQFEFQSPLFYNIFRWKNLLLSLKTSIINFVWNTSMYCTFKNKYWTDS